jgi:hypothetical protein
MTVGPSLNVQQWFDGMDASGPATDDDVSILWDGTKINSREAALKWLAEVEVTRGRLAAVESGD